MTPLLTDLEFVFGCNCESYYRTFKAIRMSGRQCSCGGLVDTIFPPFQPSASFDHLTVLSISRLGQQDGDSVARMVNLFRLTVNVKKFWLHEAYIPFSVLDALTIRANQTILLGRLESLACLTAIS